MNEERQYLLMQQIVNDIAEYAYDVNLDSPEFDKMYDDLSCPIKDASAHHFAGECNV
jgi:hypothetical protein